jgi:hypothetical protein
MAQSKQQWLRTSPFEHLLLQSALTNNLCADIFNILEQVVWKNSFESFYSIQKILHETDIEALNSLLRADAESEIRNRMEDVLRIDLGASATFTAQKYIVGDGIGPHTDSDVRAARFVFNLNRGWAPTDGGIWLLGTNSQFLPEPEYIAPVHNCGFGFVPEKNTYHALSQRNSSEAYAIIFEFPLSAL